ncbi:3-hydroxyacyl-CoA dehydrogenase NAD-binding domain-containing protein [Geodermatophilus sp. DF01_2]|uniref:3-hydroxyacyl-CoA dehydrogenase NAD-binding domain-containing protein n=1 Tax=Geodermatophilus sp. DF01-2 TaxID=2559610 RepID=UPI001FD7393B|nr:3-hydroxyacyl-CoA dehydrogenase NAD-binding domain-containing protein [Geodermatophilus sp. DF01_2]
MSEGQRSVAVVGAGTIGLSWATLFAASGMAVRVQDPRSDVGPQVAEAVHHYARTQPDQALDPEQLLSRIEVVDDVEAAVTGADVVQENAPERLPLKRELFARIEAAAPERALIASSTSALMPSDLAREMRTPERLVVGHPFNPPEVLPLVEVVPGERTAPWAVEAAVAFYREVGKKPVVLHREVNGFVANRLQSTLFRECVWLVSQGVVSAAELDEIVTESIGIRWATAGPFESFHLGGGPGGMRHFLEHLGPGMARGWKVVEQPELDEATVELISGQVESRFGGRSYQQLTEARDRAQLAVIDARDAARAAPDREE